MGSSYVTIDNIHGFWMSDSTLELWLRLLALHIREPNDRDSGETHRAARRVRDQFLLASKGYFLGCVPHGLEEAASTTEGRTLLRESVESLLKALEKAPKWLNVGTLNLLAIETEFSDNFETWRLIEVAYAFLGLLDGLITGNGMNRNEFMPGTRSESQLNQNLRGWNDR